MAYAVEAIIINNNKKKLPLIINTNTIIFLINDNTYCVRIIMYTDLNEII